MCENAGALTLVGVLSNHYAEAVSAYDTVRMILALMNLRMLNGRFLAHGGRWHHHTNVQQYVLSHG